MAQLRASAGVVDLAPQPGQWMSGYGARLKPSEGTHDPITARAVLLDDGTTRIAILSCDLIGFDYSTVQDIRREISARCDIPESSTIIACTHTHSGPASMPYRGVLGTVDWEWLASLKSKIVDLVSSLPGTLQPATFRSASTIVPDIGFNRQDSSRGIDEEAVVAAIDSADGPIAVLLNYGCHPVVMRHDNLLYSADYPGAMVRRIENARGGIGMFLQGTNGDVDPRDHYGPLASFDTAERIGGTLADAALQALESVPATSDLTLGIASEMMDVPLEAPPSPEQIAVLEAEYQAQRRQAAESGDEVTESVMGAYLDWVARLRSVLGEGPVPRSVEAEIDVLKVGDLMMVFTPFELYSDLGMEIKRSLRPCKTAYVGCTNGELGYVAAEWAKDQGGYGPNEAYKWFLSMVTGIDRSAGSVLVSTVERLAGRFTL